ncbi:MAG: zinc ABC transporter substrate-binding protein [Pseudodesulfovibrio sp.]
MIRRLLPLLLLALLALASPARAEVTVLTSLEIIHALGETLARGTDLRVVNVVPEAYPLSGHEGYYRSHGREFQAAAAGADAVLTVRSVWPDDPLYPMARRANLRVVPIDAARPLDGLGAGVPQEETEGGASPRVWRSPANLMRMAAIVSRDLARLSPSDAEAIHANLAALQSALFALRSRYEAIFLGLESVDVAVLTRDWSGLAAEFGLNVAVCELKPEGSWTGADRLRFTDRLRQRNVRAVICAFPPGEEARRAAEEAGARTVVLTRFARKGGADPSESLVRWYGDNLSRLAASLQP